MKNMLKKGLCLLISLLIIIIMFPVLPGVDAATYEYALFPGNVVNVSQGAYDSFSHQDDNAFDLIGNSNYFAPFSGSITAIKPNENAVVLQSDSPVYYANGTLDYMSVIFLHDNDISNLYIGKHLNQGEIFYQPGTKGYATGDHVHLGVRSGKDTFNNHYGSGNVYPNDALFITDSTTIVNGYGYTWRTTPDSGGSAPSYTYTSVPAGTYYLKNSSNGKYLTVENNADAEGQNVLMGDLTVGSDAHKFTLSSPQTYGYEFKPACSSTRILNIWGNNPSAGANVTIYTDQGNHPTQQWKFEKSGDGYIIHSTYNENYALDTNGSNVLVSSINGNASQVWILQTEADLIPKSDKAKITFNAQGGTLPTYSSSCAIDGYNTVRASGKMIIFNLENARVDTNYYGTEALVDSTGLITKIRAYEDNQKLTVPSGGFVGSVHAENAFSFSRNAKVGDYASYNKNSNKLYIYDTQEAYAAENKYLAAGEKYGVLPTPVLENYTFDGWYTASSGGTKITSESIFNSVSVLYAHWSNTEPHQHTWNDGVITTPATCTEEGVKTFTCTECGETYTETIPAKGHTPGAAVKENEVAPTATTAGGYDNVVYCTVCRAELSRTHVIVDPVPDDPNAPQVTVSKVTARAGETVTVDICIANNPGIVSCKWMVGFDASVLTLTAINGKDFAGVSFGPLTANPIAVNWDDVLNPNNTTNGVIAQLTFTVNENAAEGSTAIIVTYDPDDVYDQNYDNVSFGVSNGAVEIVKYIPGDVNGDGKVNNKDLGLLKQYLNGWDVEIVLAAADVTGDGKVNNKDLGLLKQYLNGWEVVLK